MTAGELGTDDDNLARRFTSNLRWNAGYSLAKAGLIRKCATSYWPCRGCSVRFERGKQLVSILNDDFIKNLQPGRLVMSIKLVKQVLSSLA